MRLFSQAPKSQVSMLSIAIIGASKSRDKFGNKAVRAYAQKGWTVYPVNPKETGIEGLVCFASVLDLPDVPSVASLYVPPSNVLPVLEDVAKKGIRKVYFNPGTESEEGIQAAKRLGLQPLLACSIRDIGVDPYAL